MLNPWNAACQVPLYEQEPENESKVAMCAVGSGRMFAGFLVLIIIIAVVSISITAHDATSISLTIIIGVTIAVLIMIFVPKLFKYLKLQQYISYQMQIEELMKNADMTRKQAIQEVGQNFRQAQQAQATRQAGNDIATALREQ